MIDTFKEDICNLVRDYNRECISSSADEVCQYVLEMLPNLVIIKNIYLTAL